jgi:hypothetical protein
VDKLAQPFVPGDHTAGMMVYWALHSDSLQNISATEADELFGERTRWIINPAFSKYEILRYRAVYGLKAEDLPKFQARDASGKAGDYFGAYRKRIQQLVTKGNTISPHLDKRWHVPAYMPDLNQELALADQRNSDRAFLLGLIYKFLRRGNQDSTVVWEHYSKSGLQEVTAGGRKIKHYFYDLCKAMPHNPAIVDSILLNAAERLNDRERMKNPGAHPFANGCENLGEQELNIIDAIVSLQKERHDLDLKEESGRLLEQCFEEIQQFFIAFLGRHQINTANAACREFLNSLIAKSVLFAEAKNGDSPTYREWQRRIDIFYTSLEAKA